MSLRSDNLNKRIDGIKVISSMARQLKYYMKRAFSSEDMVRWLKKNAVLDEIFGVRTHLQLVERSTEILKLLNTEAAF